MNRLFSYLLLIISLVGFNHSACAGPIFYKANLDGPSEAPPNYIAGHRIRRVLVRQRRHIHCPWM